MRALLDTHAILWALFAPNRLGEAARALVADQQSSLYVSAGSAWEIATKVRLGKLDEARLLEADYEQLMARAGFESLPVSDSVALLAGRLVGEHRNPFDRMIAAQALSLGMTVVSVDTKLDAFGVQRVW